MAKDLVMIDVFARFGWNPFIYINPPSGTDTSIVPAADSWTLSVGILIHASPILQQTDL